MTKKAVTTHPAGPTASRVTPVPMAKPLGPKKPSRAMLRRMTEIFAGPHLLPNESKFDYEQMQKWMFDALRPENAIEVMWVKDIVEAEIESHRLKRLRRAYLDSAYKRHLIRAVADVSVEDPMSRESTHNIAKRYVKEQHALVGGQEALRKRLRQEGVDPVSIMADAVWEKVEHLQLFDALILAAEKRRDAMIQQIGDCRSKKQPRIAASRVIDLEAEDVTSA